MRQDDNQTFDAIDLSNILQMLRAKLLLILVLSAGGLLAGIYYTSTQPNAFVVDVAFSSSAVSLDEKRFTNELSRIPLVASNLARQRLRIPTSCGSDVAVNLKKLIISFCGQTKEASLRFAQTASDDIIRNLTTKLREDQGKILKSSSRLIASSNSLDGKAIEFMVTSEISFDEFQRTESLSYAQFGEPRVAGLPNLFFWLAGALVGLVVGVLSCLLMNVIKSKEA